MQKVHKQWAANLLVVWIGFLPLAACAKEPTKPSGETSYQEPTKPTGQASYNVTLDANGLPALIGPNGRIIPAKKVTPPIPAKLITRVRTMSIIDVVGSHFVLIEIGGTLYRVDMPD